MPALYSYTVTETRTVTLGATNAVEALERATKVFESPQTAKNGHGFVVYKQPEIVDTNIKKDR